MQKLSLYEYVGGDPVNWIDPYGTQALPPGQLPDMLPATPTTETVVGEPAVFPVEAPMYYKAGYCNANLNRGLESCERSQIGKRFPRVAYACAAAHGVVWAACIAAILL